MRLGLIGHPVSHSWSPGLFARFSERDGIPARYDLFPMPDVSVLRAFLRENPDIVGLNVTIPHKTAVLSLCDALHPSAARVGAANTLLIRSCGGTQGEVHITGYNTDVGGFSAALCRFFSLATPVREAGVRDADVRDADVRESSLIRGENLKGRRALILGSGGSARAVAWALRDLGISFDLVGRAKNGEADSKVLTHAMVQSSGMQGLSQQGTSPEGTSPEGTSPQGTSPEGTSSQGTSPQGASQEGAFPQSEDAFAGARRFTYDALDSVPWEGYDLLVHCTPLGMEPAFAGQRVPVVLSYCRPSTLLFDLVYTPETTPLMQFALDCGLQVCGGIGMLEQQAEEAWTIWKSATDAECDTNESSISSS